MTLTETEHGVASDDVDARSIHRLGVKWCYAWTLLVSTRDLTEITGEHVYVDCCAIHPELDAPNRVNGVLVGEHPH
jgi:hypothetical protein